jgi:hypothetical protein
MFHQVQYQALVCKTILPRSSCSFSKRFVLAAMHKCITTVYGTSSNRMLNATQLLSACSAAMLAWIVFLCIRHFLQGGKVIVLRVCWLFPLMQV